MVTRDWSLLCLVAAFPHTAIAAEWTVNGRVVAIADGDTLTILDDAKRQHRIRIAGIDAPEKRQAFEDRSRQYLGKLVHEKRAEARCYKRDRYGREICAAIVSRFLFFSRDVGLEQVREGMAWWYREYAHEQSAEDHKAYESAEDGARAARRGLWQDKTSIPPWVWRRQ